MTTNDIDAIRKLTDAADPGPWTAHDDGLVWSTLIGDPVSGSTEQPNAEFIAAARTLVPALCDEIEQLRADLETSRSVARSNARNFATLAAVVERVDEVVKKYDAINGAFAPLVDLRQAINGRTSVEAGVAR